LSDADFEQNLSMSAHTETSSSSHIELPRLDLDSPTSEPPAKSELDQQVEDAVKDVESWLLHGPTPKTSESDIAPIVDELQEQDASFADPASSAEEQKLIVALRNTQRQMTEVSNARQQLQSRLIVKFEQEAKLQYEAFARRREEEELRLKAEEEASHRRQEDAATLLAQRIEIRSTENELRKTWEAERRLRSEIVRLNQLAHEAVLARVRDEENAKLAFLNEAQRTRDEAEAAHIDNLARLHSEEESLRQAVSRYSLRRSEVEGQRQEHELESRKLEEERLQLANALAVRLAERKRLRSEAEEKIRIDQEELSAQENELTRLAETLAQQRYDLEQARKSAEEDAKRLADARARMQNAQDANQRAERERLVLEAEIFERAEAERRLLEETRARAEEQQRQLEAYARERSQSQTSKAAELAALRGEAESRFQAQVEREQALMSELESLRNSEQAITTRIGEIETQRLAEAEAHDRVIEKLRRIEEEVTARAAGEVEARTEIERRIKEETEHLKRLEAEHQQRIADEISRRTAAEARVAEERDRYQTELAARIKAELSFDSSAGSPQSELMHSQKENDLEEEFEAFSSTSLPDFASNATPVYQVGDLSNPDPRRRADAVTALARLGTHDAYDLIAGCFDDESTLVRNAAARAMLALEPIRPAESFTNVLKDASPERKVRIGKAIAESGLANQALKGLCSEDREETYNSLCLLFTMASTGEVEPLVTAIESHEDAEVRVAAVRLLKMSGQEDLATAAVNRRLGPNG